MKLKSLCSLYNHEFKYSLSIELVEFRFNCFFFIIRSRTKAVFLRVNAPLFNRDNSLKPFKKLQNFNMSGSVSSVLLSFL